MVALQTPGLSSYPSALSSFAAQDFSIGPDMSLGPISWSSHQIPTSLAHTSGLPHLAVSSSTPPPASSPLPVKIKSEPISPPREHHPHLNTGLHHSHIHSSLNLSHSHHPRPSSAGHLTPTPGSVTPTNIPSSPGPPSGGGGGGGGGGSNGGGSDYDNVPMLKRSRLDGWPS